MSRLAQPAEAGARRLHYTETTARFRRGLADRGRLIRDESAAPGCAGCVRATAGLVEHTDRALGALEDILASRDR
jgi:histidinol-phosphate/aromatic aminotransferase/cobyric acid decarboxylase-like protein